MEKVAFGGGCHWCTSAHKLRGKYRSAVYVTTPAQAQAFENAMAQIAAETGQAFITRILSHRGFKASDARFHNYYASGPERPFCTTYISPKLAKLRRRFTPLLRTEETGGAGSS